MQPGSLSTTTTITSSTTDVTIHVPPTVQAFGHEWAKRPRLSDDETKMSPELADLQSRLRNLEKAVQNHWDVASPLDQNALISPSAIGTLTLQPQPNLRFVTHADCNIGHGRRFNEDVAFEIAIKPHGQLLAVLDGHSPDRMSGKEMAEVIRGDFPDIFSENLKNCEGRIQAAFQKSATAMQEILKARLPDSQAGSTAVFVFVEAANGYVHTFTAGDSYAFLLRCIAGHWKLKALSPIRNWAYKKDFDRADGNGAGPGVSTNRYCRMTFDEIQTQILEGEIDAKMVRLMTKHARPNVSRGFGDYISFCEGKGVVCKGKVTSDTVRPGDIVIAFSDGVTDALRPHQITDIFNLWLKMPNVVPLKFLTDKVIEHSIEMMKADPKKGDNISVVMMQILASEKSN